MKKLLLYIVLFVVSTSLWAQKKGTSLEGVVSYQSSQNVYIKFATTAGIEKGDTLFVISNGKQKPALVVDFISSLSCAGTPLDASLKLDDKVVAFVDDHQKPMPKKLKQETDPNLDGISINDSKKVEDKENPQKERKQNIDGRLSAISYLNVSNTAKPGYQKLRYNFSMDAQNLGNSRLSFETFVSFTHKLNDWAAIQTNVFNGLKIYDLSLNYRLAERTNIVFGRNINPWISSLGAVDGLQVNAGFKQLVVGAVAGFRPDFQHYGFNSSLLEYGGYIGHRLKSEKGSMETTLAFMQQMNAGNIDRRFAYFQWSNTMIKNLRLFFSSELDLYKIDNGVASNLPSLTSIYLNVNYRPTKKLTLNASYDARKNVVYYETFKSYLDQLLEESTRQGIQLRANYRLAKQIGIGASAGYRFQAADVKPTETANGYISVYQVPFIQGSFSLNTNLINNSYLDGLIYSASYSRDILPGKLSADLNFRLANYGVISGKNLINQYIGELGFAWQIAKMLSLSTTYEATFEKKNQWGMLYLNLSQRF